MKVSIVFFVIVIRVGISGGVCRLGHLWWLFALCVKKKLYL